LGWGCVSLVSPGREIGVVKEAMGGGVGVGCIHVYANAEPGPLRCMNVHVSLED